MNERIRLLAEQCRIEKYNQCGDLIEFGFDEEKFAELIVRECMWQVVKDNQVPQDIQVLIGGRFKEQFGVEE
jgi:hypothetical protein